MIMTRTLFAVIGLLSCVSRYSGEKPRFASLQENHT